MIVRRVLGESMLPTLKAGEIIIARTKRLRLQQGDVVIIRHNGLEKIKRITELTETHVIVHGDNSSESTDSRQFGKIPQRLVVGKAVLAIGRSGSRLLRCAAVTAMQ